MKCFIFVKAFSFGRQLFFWSGGAMDGHHDSWQAHMFRGIFQLIYQQVSFLVPTILDLSGERILVGIAASVWTLFPYNTSNSSC